MSVSTVLLAELVQQVPAAPAPVPTNIFDTGKDLAEDARGLFLAGAGLIAILLVIITTWKTKTLAGFLGSLAVGALFFWGVNNVSSPEVQTEIEDTVNQNGAPAPGERHLPPVTRS